MNRDARLNYASAKSARDAAKVEFMPPLQPRKRLFVVLCVAFAVWTGLLVILYFRTVYPPHRVPVLRPVIDRSAAID